VTGLTARDRDIIGRARELADTIGVADFSRITGHREDDEPAAVFANALGRAQSLLAELVAIAERPGSEAEDTRRLAEIRAVLAAFNCEFDDRQYVLEQIERIVEGGSDAG
jgi:hypothetical protein